MNANPWQGLPAIRVALSGSTIFSFSLLGNSTFPHCITDLGLVSTELSWPRGCSVNLYLHGLRRQGQQSQLLGIAPRRAVSNLGPAHNSRHTLDDLAGYIHSPAAGPDGGWWAQLFWQGTL